MIDRTRLHDPTNMRYHVCNDSRVSVRARTRTQHPHFTCAGLQLPVHRDQDIDLSILTSVLLPSELVRRACGVECAMWMARFDVWHGVAFPRESSVPGVRRNGRSTAYRSLKGSTLSC